MYVGKYTKTIQYGNHVPTICNEWQVNESKVHKTGKKEQLLKVDNEETTNFAVHRNGRLGICWTFGFNNVLGACSYVGVSLNWTFATWEGLY